MSCSLERRRSWITPKHSRLSVRCQCQLLGLAPASYYYQAEPESVENLHYMELQDREYTDHPFYGVLKMTIGLRLKGYAMGPKRVRRLLRSMGLMAVYPKPRLSLNPLAHRRFRYLLKGVSITRANQVWSTDITYIRLRGGFVFLAAVMDWYSRSAISSAVSFAAGLSLSWSASVVTVANTPPFVVQSATQLPTIQWVRLSTNDASQIAVSLAGDARYFMVLGQ